MDTTAGLSLQRADRRSQALCRKLDRSSSATSSEYDRWLWTRLDMVFTVISHGRWDGSFVNLSSSLDFPNILLELAFVDHIFIGRLILEHLSA